MIPSKEDILIKHELELVSNARELGWDTEDYIKCNHAAMDEYAKEIAIGFDKWKANEGYYPFNEIMYCYRHPLTGETTYSVDYLYQSYLNTLKQ